MEVNCQLHVLAALLLGKRAVCTHCIEVWMGPRTCLDAVAKEDPYPCQATNPGHQARSLASTLTDL